MSKESYLDILETKSTEPNKNEIKVYYNNIDPYSSFSPKKKFSLTSKISKNLNFLKTNNELMVIESQIINVKKVVM